MQTAKKMMSRGGIFIILLLAISSVAVAVSSSSRLKIEELPRDNFVNLKLEINKTNDRLILSTASGFAYRTIDDYTYILTAQHFCIPIQELSNMSEIEGASVVLTNFNNIQAFPVFIDYTSDLCLLRVDAGVIDIRNMKVADEMPVEGSRVLALSAPMGISEDGVVLQFEGFYSGCNVYDICYFTIPSTGGSSGSIILNQHGKIVSMIQRTVVDFNSVSLGVGNESINLFLENASQNLGVDLL